MRDQPTFEVFCADPQLLNEPISKPWAVFYAAMDGLALDEEGVEIFRQCTGRDRYEPRIFTDSLALCGRRAEKTATALKYLIYKSQFAGWDKQLRPSFFDRIARHTRLLRIPLIAQDMRVANDIKRMAEALVLDSPLMSREVADVRANEIVFRNGVSLICLPSSKASCRGMSCPGGFLDELAWVIVEGASDVELVRQLKPSMIQFGASRRLIKATTPWLRSGVAFDEFSKRAERPDLLVWQASTQFMTPRISPEELERERFADPVYFAREFLAEFPSGDLESFIPESDVHAAVGSWNELAPAADTYYIAALDASGLSGGDRFTFGIAHSDKDGAQVDVLRGWRRAPVPQVCDEIASLAKFYRVQKIIADQYSYPFLAELMRQRGVELAQQPFSARSKPEIFFALKNGLSQGKFQIPNHAEAAKELRMLESLRTSGGAYRISAPRGLHDDYATTLALLAHKIEHSSAPHEPHVLVLQIPRRGQPMPQTVGKELGDYDFGSERWWRPLG